MAQQQWTVPGMAGQSYSIGMYHGVDSGHLMVHCNNEILLIEFKVLESNNFSFFLGEELYELKIEKNGSHFDYQLLHNEDIDSPYNRRVGAEKKTDKWRLLALGIIGALFLLFVIHTLSKSSQQDDHAWERLQVGEGLSTNAYIFEKDGTWYAKYVVDGRMRRRLLPYYESISVLGFPRQEGDKLPARYIETSPELLLVDWDRPGEEQLARYRELTLGRHAALHPELAIRQVRCQVALAEKLEGVQGLSKFYRQADEDFPTYNKNAYLRLIRSQAFREGLGNCL